MFYTVVIMVATVFAVGVAYAPIEPEIELLKEVSVDGGVTFFDANDSASAPATAVGGGALYRLTVTNTGTSDLVNVVINDATLGIVNFLVGNLAAGQTVVLTAGEIPQLDQPGRCEVPGDVTNIATVNGDSVDTGNTLSDSDPAVVRCEEEEGCLTRTPGFWCTHDRVTELFLPVASCGIVLDNIEAASPGSAIEDLDFSGRDFKAGDTSPQQLQLIRQCTAAALNFAASVAEGGSCSGIVLSDGRTIDEVFAACCEELCTSGASGPTISESNCIERLDEFNNLEPDTLTCETDPPAPFPFCPSLGANGFNATPETCQEANGNGFVNPGRNLGPKK
jgi:hypothetical protein